MIPEIYGWTVHDWSQISPDQYEGMIRRATAWENDQAIEAGFVEDWRQMRSHGLRYRLMFQRMVSWLGWQKQADALLRAIDAVGGLTEGEGVELDIETTRNSIMSVDACGWWLQYLEERGVRCGTYVGWYTADLNNVLFRTHPTILSRPWRLPWWSDSTYPGDTGPWWSRQFNCTAPVPGFSGDVCKNYVTRPDVGDRLVGRKPMPKLVTRDEWLVGYRVAAGEGSAWWGNGTAFDANAIDNITFHWPGGTTNEADPIGSLQSEQASYHRRTDGGNSGKPAPFSGGYDLGYNAIIWWDGTIYEVRWFDRRCAANGGSDANRRSFAIQLATDTDRGPSQAQIDSARWLVQHVYDVLGRQVRHTCHQDWFGTSCPGPFITPMVREGKFQPTSPQEEDMTPDEMRDMWNKEFFPQIVLQIHNEVLSQVTRSANGSLDDPNAAGKGEYAAWFKTYLRTVRDEIVPKNADGTPVFTDLYGTGLGGGSGATWTDGYTLEGVKQILALVKQLPTTPSGGGPTMDQMVTAFKMAIDGARIRSS